MEGIDRTALAPADAARVHESDEPETTPLTSTVDDAERAAAFDAPSTAARSGHVSASATSDAARDAAARTRAHELAAASARQGGVPASEPKPEHSRGVAAVFAGLLLAMFVSTLFPWISPQIFALFALFFVAAVAFVLVERKAKEPIIPMLLFKNRNFVVCTVTGMFIMLGMMGTISYLPTYFQIVEGLAPEQAGLMTVPMMAGVLITAVGTGFLATKTGRYKWMPIASCAVTAVGFVLLSQLTVGTPLVVTGVFLFVLGFGIGLGQQILVLIVQNEFPHAIVGTATAANNFFRQIGSTLGASLVGALFTSRLTADLAAKLPHVDNINMNRITPDFVQHLDSGTRAIITSAYSDALVPIFLYVVPLLVVGFVLMLTLKEHPLATKVNHTGHPGDTV